MYIFDGEALYFQNCICHNKFRNFLTFLLALIMECSSEKLML